LRWVAAARAVSFVFAIECGYLGSRRLIAAAVPHMVVIIPIRCRFGTACARFAVIVVGMTFHILSCSRACRAIAISSPRASSHACRSLHSSPPPAVSTAGLAPALTRAISRLLSFLSPVSRDARCLAFALPVPALRFAFTALLCLCPCSAISVYVSAATCRFYRDFALLFSSHAIDIALAIAALHYLVRLDRHADAPAFTASFSFFLSASSYPRTAATRAFAGYLWTCTATAHRRTAGLAVSAP